MGKCTQQLAAALHANYPEYADLIEEMFPDPEPTCCICFELAIDVPDLVSHIRDTHANEYSITLATMHKVIDLAMFLEKFESLFRIEE